jgi:hypothetical protein
MTKSISQQSSNPSNLHISIIAEPLVHIINLSITSGIVPDEMKIACVIPL